MYYSAQEYLDFMERVNQLTIQNHAVQRDNEILAKYRSNDLNPQSMALQESRSQRWNQPSRAKIPQEKENWHTNEPETSIARYDPNPSFSQFEKCIEKQIKMSVEDQTKYIISEIKKIKESKQENENSTVTTVTPKHENEVENQLKFLFKLWNKQKPQPSMGQVFSWIHEVNMDCKLSNVKQQYQKVSEKVKEKSQPQISKAQKQEEVNREFKQSQKPKVVIKNKESKESIRTPSQSKSKPQNKVQQIESTKIQQNKRSEKVLDHEVSFIPDQDQESQEQDEQGERQTQQKRENRPASLRTNKPMQHSRSKDKQSSSKLAKVSMTKFNKTKDKGKESKQGKNGKESKIDKEGKNGNGGKNDKNQKNDKEGKNANNAKNAKEGKDKSSTVGKNGSKPKAEKQKQKNQPQRPESSQKLTQQKISKQKADNHGSPIWEKEKRGKTNISAKNEEGKAKVPRKPSEPSIPSINRRPGSVSKIGKAESAKGVGANRKERPASTAKLGK